MFGFYLFGECAFSLESIITQYGALWEVIALSSTVAQEIVLYSKTDADEITLASSITQEVALTSKVFESGYERVSL